MKTKVSFTKEVEIKLPQPLYVCYADKAFYKFTETENDIEVLQFRESDYGNSKFELDKRIGIYEHQIDIATLKHEYAKQITEDQFYSKLNECINKYIFNKEIVGVLYLTPEQQIEAEKELDSSLID